MRIRTPLPGDAGAVLAVHRAAFAREDEARLVASLWASGRSVFEQLAECDGAIVGHVLFSPVRIAEGDDGLAIGLAPMAVLPDWQRRGIGTGLLEASLRELADTPYRAIVVLGDPAFYARFGFRPAAATGLHDTYGGGDAFMALALREDGLSGYRGQVDYASEFDALTD
jgi:putative acetyltransferase